MNEWIAITERLPEENQKIRIACDGQWIGEGVFYGGKIICETVKGACFGNTTHWMPMERVSLREAVKEVNEKVDDFAKTCIRYGWLKGFFCGFVVSVIIFTAVSLLRLY